MGDDIQCWRAGDESRCEIGIVEISSPEEHADVQEILLLRAVNLVQQGEEFVGLLWRHGYREGRLHGGWCDETG